MNIDLKDLQLFIEVANAGNLTRGAEKAFLSPPAASARIKALERNLNRKLLYRGNKGVSLTQSGETVLRHAKLLMRQLDYLQDDLSEGASHGHIKIFANTTAVTEFLPEVLAEFLSERPNVSVDLQEQLTDDILRAIIDGNADLGIVSGEIDRTDLEVMPFSTDRLVVVTPTEHPLNGMPDIQFAETLSFQHIGLHEGSTLLAFLRSLMVKNGYERSLRLQVRSFEAMCRLIEANVGVGIVPESAARRHSRTMNINIVHLSDDWAVRTRYVLARSFKSLPTTAQALVDALLHAGAGGSIAESAVHLIE